MSLIEQGRTIMDPRVERGSEGHRLQQGRARKRAGVNVGENERLVSVAAGAILAALGVARRSVPGVVIAGVGGAMLYRGVTGWCHLSAAMGVDSAEEERDPRIHVEQAFLINRSPEELYGFWRNFENLPKIMMHLESVRVIDERRSHWVARAPRLPGGRVEWDAVITRDDANALIAWESVEGSDIICDGQIRFAKAIGDRGTEVHVFMNYDPPGGVLGNWMAKLSGNDPSRLLREDLRNFKRLMEVGEIPTIIGQPHGTCTGRGVQYTESEWKPLFS